MRVTYIWSNRGRYISISWKLVVIPKIPQSQDFRNTFKQNLTCIFLSVRLHLLLSVHSETPCRKGKLSREEILLSFFFYLCPVYGLIFLVWFAAVYQQLYILYQGSRKAWKSRGGSSGGHNLPPPMVEFGLTETPKYGESGSPPCPQVPTALLISIQPGFQANVCKKTSCFFPSPWHLCAWNNDRDFSSDAICCWVRHCFYIYRQMPCDRVNTVDLLMSHFLGSQRGHSKSILTVTVAYLGFWYYGCRVFIEFFHCGCWLQVLLVFFSILRVP